MEKEEAIKVAIEMHGWLQTDREREALETLIPELREDDDDRIRKEIISALKWANHGGVYDEHIAYLENLKPSFRQIHDGAMWDSGLRAGIELGKKKQKSLNISAASEWLRKYVCNYVNSEYNEFHKCVEYDGSIDKEKLINDFEEAMQKETENISASTMIPSCWAEEPSLQKEQKEIPLMNGDADLYFDEWNQQNQNPTKRQCFEEGMRYAQRLQKEQKPVEWNKATINGEPIPTENRSVDIPLAEWSEDIIQKAVKEAGLTQHQIDWFKTNVFPPKQEWSEEDVKTFWRFTAYIPDEELKKLGVTRLDILKKFKSLRPVKQEWSEEDRRHLDRIRMVLESWDRSHISLAGLPSTIPDDIDWLEKKLECFYPHPHWKPSEVCYGAKGDPDPAGVWIPSEEQMNAFNKFLCDGEFSYIGQATKLQELYVELEKYKHGYQG